MFNINREYYSHKICGILWKKKKQIIIGTHEERNPPRSAE